MEKKLLRNIPLEQIFPNDENPRIIFRQEELDSLTLSIKKMGLQVPITVYEDRRNKYKIIDGERRWRVFKKLNFKTIPAIIQEKPSELDNLLIMFNIHALREQWDLFTISNKLTKIIELHQEKHGKDPKEADLSLTTGLTRGMIRRCKLLIELPDRYKEKLLKELKKPKGQQKLSEDLFIEMEKALKTVDRRLPGLIKNLNTVRDVLLEKYTTEIIKNITDFRMLSRIATAVTNLGFDKKTAVKNLTSLFEKNTTGIESVYTSTVSHLYNEKKFIDNARNILNYIEGLEDSGIDDKEVKGILEKMRDTLNNILD